VPLNPEFLKRLREVAAAVEATPFTVLVWGPGIPAESAQGRKRQRIKEHLQAALGSAANVVFSEELEEIEELQSKSGVVSEYYQLRATDAVVLIAESRGSLTEAALYKSELRSKCITFVERRDTKGFAQNAYSTLNVKIVEHEEWDECKWITREAQDYVEELRLEKYRLNNVASGFDWEEPPS
jgi:hypothetical protein